MRVQMTMTPSSYQSQQYRTMMPVIDPTARCLQKPHLSLGLKMGGFRPPRSTAFFAPIQHPSTIIVPSSSVSPSSPSQDKPVGTGVYFNNCEIHTDMHPVQVRYANRYTTVVPKLPQGKPMPQPPTLALKSMGEGQYESRSSPSPNERPLEEGKRKRSLNQEDSIRDEPEAKVKRTSRREEESSYASPVNEVVLASSTSKKTLSSEQKNFLEAALALTEMGASTPRLLPPSVQLASTTSPKSVVPPPPLCMPSAPFDLRGPRPKYEMMARTA